MSERTPSAIADRQAVDDGPGGESWEPQPEILDDLHSLLAGLDTGDDKLEADVRALELSHGDVVYSELICLLSHLKFPPSEAKPHWDRIVRHRDSMRERLGGAVDFRVALVSYFVQVNRQLKNPKVIEMKLFERERDSAYRDMLTGLYNYRLFLDHLQREAFRADRYSKPLSLLMIDVDHFKNYNDGNGHEDGNQALREVASLITGSLRKTDFAARYGGDEFALILPATPKTSAQLIAERTREIVDRHEFVNQDALSGGELTISVGVATLPADAADANELVRHADRALYLAKAAGKNQVRLYGQSRRSFGRVNVTMPGAFRMLADETHTLSTINLSEGGLLFRTDQELPAGAMVEFTVTTDADRQITASGRVVHVEEDGDGAYRIAVCLVDAQSTDRARLLRLIRQAAVSDLPLDDGPSGRDQQA
jgi:diguanylate cyclase (GGDEF)-like protein